MTYIVATDGSEEGNDAVSYAAEHAATFGEPLEIVHVLNPALELVDEQLVIQDQDSATDEGHEILRNAADVATEAVPSHDLDVRTQLLTGEPAGTVTDRARAVDAEAIYVGHRGLSRKQEEMVGSVAKEIVSKATVPVTVVR